MIEEVRKQQAVKKLMGMVSIEHPEDQELQHFNIDKMSERIPESKHHDRVNLQAAKGLIAAGKLKEAVIMLMRKLDQVQNQDIHESVIMLSSRLNRLDEQQSRGVVASNEYNLRANEIMQGLLFEIDRIAQELMEEKPGYSSGKAKASQSDRRRYIFWGSTVVIMIALFFLAKNTMVIDEKGSSTPPVEPLVDPVVIPSPPDTVQPQEETTINKDSLPDTVIEVTEPKPDDAEPSPIEPPISITGNVLDPGNRGLSNVTIRIVGGGNVIHQNTLSDGSFKIELGADWLNQDVTLWFSHPDYLEVAKPISPLATNNDGLLIQFNRRSQITWSGKYGTEAGVLVYTMIDGKRYKTTTEEGGFFELKGIPGKWEGKSVRLYLGDASYWKRVGDPIN